MYTSHIGKQFLDTYNRTMNKNFTSREFFEKEYFPLFFDHAKYLQSPANTPLFQLIARRQTQSAKARKEMLEQVHAKIAAFVAGAAPLPEMSYAIGYPSADLMGTTSGQVSNQALPLEGDDMYSSWFGSALGIGIEGGLNILVDNADLMLLLYEGWKIYREHVEQNEGIDNKIDTWNSIWLVHRLSDSFNPKYPAKFQSVSPGKKEEAVMQRPPWTRIIFALSKMFPKSRLNAYTYSFGQMNKTVGFIQLSLQEVTRLSQIYQAVFGKMQLLKDTTKLAEVYEAQRGFNFACESGVIGLRALEPKGLRKFMPGHSDKNEYPREKNIESQITNTIYISWVLAMLNNKDLLALAERAAAMLHDYVSREKRAKATRGNLSDKLLNSKGRKEFVEHLTAILEDDPATSDVCSALVNEVMLNIPPDNVPLFVTLMRFKYALPTK